MTELTYNILCLVGGMLVGLLLGAVLFPHGKA